MRQVINCTHEKNPLINKTLKKVSVEDGMRIATELFGILNRREDGIGLAANQVGIDAQVAVLNVREPIILINPKYIETGDEIPYYEGCLSFKGKSVNTKRFNSVVIKTEQDDSNWYFSGATTPTDNEASSQKKEKNKRDAELRLLETVCIQHEIDHLNGLTIMDRKLINTITTQKTIGRNDPCHCGSGKKYKKCCI